MADSVLAAQASLKEFKISIVIGENTFEAAEGSTVTDLKYLVGNNVETVSGTVDRIVLDTKIAHQGAGRIYDGIPMNAKAAVNDCTYLKTTDILVPTRLIIKTAEGSHVHVDLKLVTEIGSIA